MDVWAYGITLYVFLLNSLPFLNKEGRKIENYEDILKVVDVEAEIREVYKANNFSQELIDFQLKLLKRDPLERPSFAQILEDPWFSDRKPEVFENLELPRSAF